MTCGAVVARTESFRSAGGRASALQEDAFSSGRPVATQHALVMKQQQDNDIPEHSSFLAVLQSWASERPEQRVFTFRNYGEGGARDVAMTWGGLEREARGLGARLQELGL